MHEKTLYGNVIIHNAWVKYTILSIGCNAIIIDYFLSIRIKEHWVGHNGTKAALFNFFFISKESLPKSELLCICKSLFYLSFYCFRVSGASLIGYCPKRLLYIGIFNKLLHSIRSSFFYNVQCLYFQVWIINLLFYSISGAVLSLWVRQRTEPHIPVPRRTG